MNKRLKYSGTDKMSDLICENYNRDKCTSASEADREGTADAD